MGDVYILNGKILSGLPNHAKDIIIDNTGTTLNSTNTEDAIKEVNSNLSQITSLLNYGIDVTTETVTSNSNGNVTVFTTKPNANSILIAVWGFESGVANYLGSAFNNNAHFMTTTTNASIGARTFEATCVWITPLS